MLKHFNIVTGVVMLQEVGYVDAQRNMAVTMGERDVKTDVKEKSKSVELCLHLKTKRFLMILKFSKLKFNPILSGGTNTKHQCKLKGIQLNLL